MTYKVISISEQSRNSDEDDKKTDEKELVKRLLERGEKIQNSGRKGTKTDLLSRFGVKLGLGKSKPSTK